MLPLEIVLLVVLKMVKLVSYSIRKHFNFTFQVRGIIFVGDGDITGITAGTALDGGGVSGAVTLNVDVNSAVAGTVASGDELLIADVSDSNNVKKLPHRLLLI